MTGGSATGVSVLTASGNGAPHAVQNRTGPLLGRPHTVQKLMLPPLDCHLDRIRCSLADASTRVSIGFGANTISPALLHVKRAQRFGQQALLWRPALAEFRANASSRFDKAPR